MGCICEECYKKTLAEMDRLLISDEDIASLGPYSCLHCGRVIRVTDYADIVASSGSCPPGACPHCKRDLKSPEPEKSQGKCSLCGKEGLVSAWG